MIYGSTPYDVGQELQKLCNYANALFPVKRPFIYSLLRVTKFSMLFTYAEFSADQNGGFGKPTALTLAEICV